MPSTTTENKNRRSERDSSSGDDNDREMSRGDESHASVQRLKEQAITVGEDIQELAQTAGAAAREQFDPVDEYVRRQPLKSLLIAAAVGAVLGMFFRRH